jgi:hypothetical protein
MGLITGIEWCDSTNNPAMGCDGCELEYRNYPSENYNSKPGEL